MGLFFMRAACAKFTQIQHQQRRAQRIIHPMKHLHLPEFSGPTWIVGDIHGAFSDLDKHLAARGYTPETHRLVCCGDLVDRGAESHRAIEFLQRPNVYSVQGNHEAMMREFHRGEFDRDLYVMNGGSWFVAMTIYERAEYVEYLGALPVAITIDTTSGPVGVAHAACAKWTWAEFLENLHMPDVVDRAQWYRGPMYRIDDVRAVVSGHTVVSTPTRHHNTIMIDTAGWHPRGNGFTVLDVETLEVVAPLAGEPA